MSTEIAVKAKQFDTILKEYEIQLASLLQDSIPVDRYIRVIYQAVRKTPALLDCDKGSLFASIMMAAQVGLEPNTPQGHCWLIPYGKQATLQFGYKGLVELAYRSGKVGSIDADVVYENDEFNYVKGLSPVLEHKPLMQGDRGNLIGTYAVADLVGGFKVFFVMRSDEVEKIRNRSIAYKSAQGDSIDGLKSLTLYPLFVIRSSSYVRSLQGATSPTVHLCNLQGIY